MIGQAKRWYNTRRSNDSKFGLQQLGEHEVTASVHDPARRSISFLPAVATAVALGSTGAPSLADATRVGIICSGRLSTRGETGVSTWTGLKRSAS
jgi:hypothetical protein